MNDTGHLDLRPGDDFAGYKIERVLGRGGMGVVYVAIEVSLDRRVALKLIAPEIARDDVYQRRFESESKIAASIEHPNVIPIYGVGVEQGVPFISMRYVQGNDLGEHLRGKGRLEPGRATSITGGIAAGLDALHRAGLIHRDVKPANVLIDEGTSGLHVYLTDFGLAKASARTSGFTVTGSVVGTLSYVAPEQITRAPVEAGTDIYSLGCLLYELLTGTVPFPAESQAAVIWSHLNDAPPHPSDIDPALAAFDPVISRAMAKEVSQRFSSAGDLGRAAEAAARGEQIERADRTPVGDLATEAGAGSAIGEEEGDSGETATALVERRTAMAPAHRHRAARGPSRWIGGIEEGISKARARLAGARPRLRLSSPPVLAALIVGVLAVGGMIVLRGEGKDPVEPRDLVSSTEPDSTEVTETDAASAEELIASADAICVESRDPFAGAMALPVDDQQQIVDRVSALADISQSVASGLAALTPPDELAGVFAEYVDSRQRFAEYLATMEEAALSGDPDSYVSASGQIDAEAQERFDLARAVGLVECSSNAEPLGI